MQYCAKMFAERHESNLLVVAIQLWWSWSHEDSITRHDDVAEYLIVYINCKYQQYRGTESGLIIRAELKMNRGA